MKTLYLVRHAKAVSRDTPIPDFERGLSEHGWEDARHMAGYVKGHGPAPDVLVSSPAPRALETAQIFAQAYRYPTPQIIMHAAIYDEADAADATTVLNILRSLDETYQTAMLFGHDPLWSACAHFFDPDFTTPLPTCAVACLTFATSAWAEIAPGRGTVTGFYTPQKAFPDQTPSDEQATPGPSLTFDPPKGWHPDHVVSALQSVYRMKREKRVHEHAAYYDTFDWRLFNASHILVCTAHHAILQSLRHESTVCEAAIASPPVFFADVPPGELHTRLAALLDVRALLRLFELTSHYETLRVVNDDEKTVMRVVVEQHRIASARGTPPWWTRIRLKPVKGYAKDAQKVRKRLVQSGFIPCQDTLYQRALAAVHTVPNDYVSKPRFQLDPQMRADEATKQILRFLFAVMRRNEAGIIEDIDTEFLHDFRVAIRRTRSALGQIKAVFPAPLTERFRRDFAWLGSMTNRVRDLDVYLLKQDAYKAQLSLHHRGAIDPLFALLRHERATAHMALVRQLRSKKYHEIRARWEAFLATPSEQASASAPAAVQPILLVARKRIKKRCRAVVTLGTALFDSGDEQGLHRLRIACKKLRYLLEFFDSLFPADHVTPLVKHLRKLQDNLGDFHDLYVQQTDLHTFATRLANPDHQARHIQSAIGGLIEILEGEKSLLRKAFPTIFKSFAACAARTRFSPLHHT